MTEILTPPPSPLPAKPPRRRAQGMPTEAPRLTIHYRCPVCSADIAMDAYDGPPVCEGKATDKPRHRAWMVALEIVGDGLEDRPGPLADIAKAKANGDWHGLGPDGYVKGKGDEG